MVDEKLRRIKDHRVFLQIGGEKTCWGAALMRKEYNDPTRKKVHYLKNDRTV